MEQLETSKTVFGEVLAGLLAERGIVEITPSRIEGLAKRTSIDAGELLRRIEDADADYPGPLGDLVWKLDLSQDEMLTLAFAYAFERQRSATLSPGVS